MSKLVDIYKSQGSNLDSIDPVKQTISQSCP